MQGQPAKSHWQECSTVDLTQDYLMTRHDSIGSAKLYEWEKKTPPPNLSFKGFLSIDIRWTLGLLHSLRRIYNTVEMLGELIALNSKITSHGQGRDNTYICSADFDKMVDVYH